MHLLEIMTGFPLGTALKNTDKRPWPPCQALPLKGQETFPIIPPPPPPPLINIPFLGEIESGN